MDRMQPGGLRESSGWSQCSEDHRLKEKGDRTPTGCQTGRIALKFSHHSVVQIFYSIDSGGFRFASTTGYYLPALRADTNTKGREVELSAFSLSRNAIQQLSSLGARRRSLAP